MDKDFIVPEEKPPSDFQFCCRPGSHVLQQSANVKIRIVKQFLAVKLPLKHNIYCLRSFLSCVVEI